MNNDTKKHEISIVIVLTLFLLIAGLTIATNTFAKYGRVPDSDGTMASMTGRVDKIGTEYIIIDDTSFKLSDQVSAEGYKVGDRVTFVATYKSEIIKMSLAGRTNKKRQPKE